MLKLIKDPYTFSAIFIVFALAGSYMSPTSAQRAPQYQPPTDLIQALRANTRALQENTRELRSAKMR